MSLIGYARVSTDDQHLDGQIAALTAAGCVTIHKEWATGTKATAAARPEFNRMLQSLQMGDVVVVTKLDRIARSIRDLLDIVDQLDRELIGFKVLNAAGVDTTTATGKLMLNILGSIAEFEREMMLERQKDGITRAKAAGAYKGRAPTAQRESARVLDALAAGSTRASVAEQCGVSVASVYRIQRANKAAQAVSRHEV